MSKQAERQQKRTSRHNRREDGNVVDIQPTAQRYDKGVGKTKKLTPRTKAQTNYLQLIDSKQLIFGEGPAGTGKTYIAVAWACQQFLDNRISQIVITRPIVEAGEELGFLPGEVVEKVAPYFEPVRKIMLEYFTASHLELLLKRESIVFAPLAYMRGITFDQAFVLLDEAQNCTEGQMKLFLTRIGENTTVVIDGDTDQVDIKGASGLSDALRRVVGLADVGHYVFDEDDIVRSGLCREIVKRYRSTGRNEERVLVATQLPVLTKVGYFTRLWRALLGRA